MTSHPFVERSGGRDSSFDYERCGKDGAVENMKQGAGEMGQWVRTLSCKFKGMSLNPQHPQKVSGMAGHVCHLSLGGSREEDLRSSLASHLSQKIKGVILVL